MEIKSEEVSNEEPHQPADVSREDRTSLLSAVKTSAVTWDSQPPEAPKPGRAISPSEVDESNKGPKQGLSDSTDVPHQSSCTKRAWRDIAGNDSKDYSPNECRITGNELAIGDEKFKAASTNTISWCLRMELVYYILAALLALLALLTFAPQDLLHPVTRSFCSLSNSTMPLLCGYVPKSPRQPLRADFRLLKGHSDAIDTLIVNSLGNSELVLKIAKAEMAADDLASAVRFSDLKIRDHLAGLLNEFARSAGITAEELQELHAQIVGTANTIAYINHWALRSIEDAVLKDAASRYSYVSVATDRALERTFDEVMSLQSTELERLVTKALFIKGHLDELQEKLRVMHRIVTHENRDLTIAERELLSTLWSTLGGNHSDKKRFKTNFVLLDQLENYHQQARDRVAAAIFSLNDMRYHMKEVKKTVGAPSIAGPEIPLEVQMKSIQDAIDRLEQSTIAAQQQRIRTGEQFFAEE